MIDAASEPLVSLLLLLCSVKSEQVSENVVDIEKGSAQGQGDEDSDAVSAWYEADVKGVTLTNIAEGWTMPARRRL